MSSRILLSGLRSIEECLRVNPDRIAKLYLPLGRLSPRLEKLREQAGKMGIKIEAPSKPDGEEGCSALLEEYQYADFDETAAELAEKIASGRLPCALMLDGITDPQNLGAILRTAAFMGVAAVILPKDRSSNINETVYRVASGGLEYVPVCQVTNLVSAMAALKKAGFWSIGFSERAEQNLDSIRRDIAPLLIIGNEEKGMRALVRQHCDFLARLEPVGRFSSLNASVAAALAMQSVCARAG